MDRENNYEEPHELGAASMIKQSQEFEERLREENMHLYRQLRLKDSIAKTKKQDPGLARDAV